MRDCIYKYVIDKKLCCMSISTVSNDRHLPRTDAFTLLLDPCGSKTTATSKMELFVIIVNGFQPLTIITKCSILDVAAVLDPPLQL